MSIWAKAHASSRKDSDGEWIPVGNFTGAVTELKQFFSETKKAEIFIGSFDIKESDNPDFPVGMLGKIFVNLSQFDGAYAGDAIRCIAASGGSNDWKSLTEEDLEMATADDQPFVGNLVNIQGYTYTTKNGKELTKYKYRAVAA